MGPEKRLAPPSTTVMGRAVQAAAQDVLAQLRQIAADMGGCAAEDVHFAAGTASWPGGSATYAELVWHFFGTRGGEILGRGYSGRRVPGSIAANWPLFWEVALAGAEVTVDRETGAVRVDRYTSVTDVGKAINPPALRGQEEGAAVMGLGGALLEELHFIDGQPVGLSLAEYRVPSATDIPAVLAAVVIEEGDGPGPFGARGAGEGGVVPAAGAVANALFWATGVRVKELPLTPERVWRALRAAAAGEASTAAAGESGQEGAPDGTAR